MDLRCHVVADAHAANYLCDNLSCNLSSLVRLLDQSVSWVLSHSDSCIQISLSDLNLALERGAGGGLGIG